MIPNDPDQPAPASNEVQFALVIARMIDTVKNDPEHMRHAVYELARYKLQEQFTHLDAKDVRRTRQELESAICGVEEFSRQQFSIPARRSAIGNDIGGTRAQDLPAAQASPVARPRRRELESDPASVRKAGSLWPVIGRTAAVLVVFAAGLAAFQYRDRLASPAHDLSKSAPPNPVQPSAPPAAVVAPPPAKPNPLLPKDYGIYAISNGSLIELQLLPGRPPDIRIAVSAALKAPSKTVLRDGQPKFIVFRRDVAANVPDRAEVRIMAKVAREFSVEAASKKLDENDETWVIRNVSFPFRASPVPDNPEMYELHSEDPGLQLTPGRYALILKSQAYDFTVEGKIVDPRQCIERIVATNGTFYAECKRP